MDYNIIRRVCLAMASETIAEIQSVCFDLLRYESIESQMLRVYLHTRLLLLQPMEGNWVSNYNLIQRRTNINKLESNHPLGEAIIEMAMNNLDLLHKKRWNIK